MTPDQDPEPSVSCGIGSSAQSQPVAASVPLAGGGAAPSEMEARVAAAFFETSTKLNGIPVRWERCSPDVRATYEQIARAAIEAMREPTEAMLRAGEAEVGPADSRFQTARSCIECAWDEMIDAALQPMKEREA